jgi:hypothetical protein
MDASRAFGTNRAPIFAYSGTPLGSKLDLRKQISDITGIGEAFLDGTAPLSQASIARRMSWASRRETTRTEDLAYCLLGIFNISMPLLYGEDEKAFSRLQQEIMRNSDDQSLFAWGLGELLTEDLAIDELDYSAKNSVAPLQVHQQNSSALAISSRTNSNIPVWHTRSQTKASK